MRSGEGTGGSWRETDLRGASVVPLVKVTLMEAGSRAVGLPNESKPCGRQIRKAV